MKAKNKKYLKAVLYLLLPAIIVIPLLLIFERKRRIKRGSDNDPNPYYGDWR